MIDATWIGAFAVGLIGSPHCVGMCGGFAGATASQGPGGFGAWSGGRIATYAVLGALAGVLGQALSWVGLVGAVLSFAMLLWLAARIAGLVPAASFGRSVAHGHLGALIQRARRAGPFVFGMATALLPCGLVYAALALPIVSASPINGALAMTAFGLGTSPLLAAVGFGAWRLQTNNMALRRSVAAIVVLAGLWSLQARTPWALVTPEVATEVASEASTSTPGLPNGPCH